MASNETHIITSLVDLAPPVSPSGKPIMPKRYLVAFLDEEQFASRGSDTYHHLYNVGFVPLEKIVGYQCKKCGGVEQGIKEQGAPKVEATIEVYGPEDKLKADLCYSCLSCEELVCADVIEDERLIRKIPPEIISLDESGEIKIPTDASIEQLLWKINQRANMGDGDFSTPGYSRELKTLKRWCGKIRYTLEESNLEEMEKRRKDAYVANYNRELPQYLDMILEQKEAFSLLPDEVEGVTSYDIYLRENMTELLQVLPHLPIINDPKIIRDLSTIMELYQGMQRGALRDQERELRRTRQRVQWTRDALKEGRELIERLGLLIR